MKNYLKSSIRIISLLFVLPLLILFWVGSIIMPKASLFITYSQMLSLIPGKFGSYLRCAFYHWVFTTCHNDCVISFATVFSQIDTEIASGVYIGPQCNIGMCRIEQNSLIGSGVHIISGKNQHIYSDISTPIKQQGGIFKKIVIGEDTWIGNGALIMANVGKKCVIAAGSVVVKDVPDYSVMAGNPATLVKDRRS